LFRGTIKIKVFVSVNKKYLTNPAVSDKIKLLIRGYNVKMNIGIKTLTEIVSVF